VETLQQPYGRAQSILSANGNIDIVIPSLNHSLELSIALRIAHSLLTFHLLDAQILSASEAEKGQAGGGNMVVVGCADSAVVKDILISGQSDWSYKSGAWALNDRRFDRPSSGASGRWYAGCMLNVCLAGLLFLVKKASSSNAVLFLQSTDPQGLERVLRLFPIRTGVTVPDWLVVDGRADRIGAAGTEGAG